MKKVFFKRICTVTLLLTVTLTFNFYVFSNNVQAKNKYTDAEKVFLKTRNGDISKQSFVEFHPIPENFDATNATDEELNYYNLPARPKNTDRKKMDAWKKLVSCKWIKPEIVESQNKHSNCDITNIEKVSTTSSAVTTHMNDLYQGSRNWSGYRYNKGADMVLSDWTIPKVSAPSNYLPAAASQWIGLGGHNNDSLVQCGTAGDLEKDGSISYYPFYELIGTDYYSDMELRLDNLVFSPGDQITCQITNSISGGNMTTKFLISDSTKSIGTSFTTTVTQFSAPMSADFIAEAPTKIVNGVKKYYNYALTTDPNSNEQATRFSTCLFDTRDLVNGRHDHSLNDSAIAPDLVTVNMVNNSKLLAQPTKVGSGTYEGSSFFNMFFGIGTSESFNVNWKDYQ